MPDVPQLRPDKMYLPKGWVHSNVVKRVPIDTNQQSPRYKLAQKKKRLAAKNRKSPVNKVAYQYAYQNQLGRKIAKMVQD